MRTLICCMIVVVGLGITIPAIATQDGLGVSVTDLESLSATEAMAVANGGAESNT